MKKHFRTYFKQEKILFKNVEVSTFCIIISAISETLINWDKAKIIRISNSYLSLRLKKKEYKDSFSIIMQKLRAKLTDLSIKQNHFLIIYMRNMHLYSCFKNLIQWLIFFNSVQNMLLIMLMNFNKFLLLCLLSTAFCQAIILMNFHGNI